MKYEGSIPRAIFLVLALLTLVAGAFALRAAWETIPKAEAQVEIQQPGPNQFPDAIQQPGPQQDAGPLLNAGGLTDGPVPTMPNGNCPEEFPVQLDSSCYP